MRGVTQRVYDAFRARLRQSLRPVRQIAEEELQAIYRDQYADAIRFDDLPIGLDYVQFDGAVHSGAGAVDEVAAARPARARPLCRQDRRRSGNSTLNAVRLVKDVDALIARICDIRKAFLKALKTFPTFGKGWTARVDQVGDGGQDWAVGSVPADRNLTYQPGMEVKPWCRTPRSRPRPSAPRRSAPAAAASPS